MSGWFGYGRGGESPTDAAYSRVTNAERFLPLHAAMLEIIGQLENDFEVERTEGHGLDEELERGLDIARPDVKLIPADPDAAPIVVVFTAFPGLHVRFGRWYMEPFPDCGCDACDESAEGGIERLNDMLDDVTAGRFREAIEIPPVSFMGSGWMETKFWSPDERRSSTRSRSRSRIDRFRAREMSGGCRRLDMNWKPWPRRQLAGLGVPAEIVAALIGHRNENLRSDRASLTKEVGDLIYTNPFAFLVGAAFDRGMPWQKAWEIPYRIDQKGQLEASKLAAMEEPDLQRLLESLPVKPRYGCVKGARTLSDAANLVMKFDAVGDAGAIWEGVSPLEVQKRLESVYGVGPGIAHMAIRILAGRLGKVQRARTRDRCQA